MSELKRIYQQSPGTIARRNEKKASAVLRGRNQNRKGFDDQSNVDKLYRWIKNVTKTKQVYDPSSKHLPYTR